MKKWSPKVSGSKNGGTVPDDGCFFGDRFFPYISRIHTAYMGLSIYLHFRYQKVLMKWGWDFFGGSKRVWLGSLVELFFDLLDHLGSTLPETNSSHLKNDGWNTRCLLGWPIFRGYVSFRPGYNFDIILYFYIFLMFMRGLLPFCNMELGLLKPIVFFLSNSRPYKEIVESHLTYNMLLIGRLLRLVVLKKGGAFISILVCFPKKMVEL